MPPNTIILLTHTNMNTWSPASWQLIRHRVRELTGRRISFDSIERFIDENYLWEESPESIAAVLIQALSDQE